MSFRKRSDIIEPGASRGAPGSGLGRVPTSSDNTRPESMRNPLALSFKRAPPTGRSVISNTSPGSRLTSRAKADAESILSHPAVKPSLVTSAPTISTGTPDLDKLLLHQGLPLGTSLLVEERGNTDFSSILTKVFASQGIMHNRVAGGKKEINTHVIVVGYGAAWANELPGLYQGSKKEQQRAKIAVNESKISISNLAEPKQLRESMKIAWRYGLNQKSGSSATDVSLESQEMEKNDYCYQFDITQRLSPAPGGQEISFVPVSDAIPKQIRSIVEQNVKNGRVVRIVMPHLLHPLLYPPQFSSSFKLLPILHSLRAILRQYPHNVALVASLPTELYSRQDTLARNVEMLMDSVIELQQFNQEMMELIEKSYKNEPSKILHGLVQIYKLPSLSERGLMTVHMGEYAFKNGKKKFEIEEWGIPVEDDSKDEAATTKDIEF